MVLPKVRGSQSAREFTYKDEGSSKEVNFEKQLKVSHEEKLDTIQPKNIRKDRKAYSKILSLITF